MREDTERYLLILEMRKHGATLQAIANRCMVSRQRIWWILQAGAQRRARGRPCPVCGGKSKVWRVSPPDAQGVTRREHRCVDKTCQHLWMSKQADE